MIPSPCTYACGHRVRSHRRPCEHPARLVTRSAGRVVHETCFGCGAHLVTDRNTRTTEERTRP